MANIEKGTENVFGMSRNEKNETLSRALSSSGDIAAAKKALDRGADPNMKTYYYAAPMFQAAGMYSDTKVTEAFELLAKSGARLDTVDDYRNMPLHNVISRNPSYINAAKKLVELGADINAQNMYGRTPLFLALEKQAWDTARFLMDKGGDKVAETKYGYTLLKAAMTAEAPMDIVERLLASTGNLNLAGEKNPAALHIAVEKQKMDYVTALLAQKGIDVNTADATGAQPLFKAVEKNNIELATLLLDAGANVEGRKGTGLSALSQAVSMNAQEIAELLIARKAELDVPDGYGMTPIARAASSGNIRMVMTLLSAAEAQGEKLQLEMALSAAAERGHGRILELLIAAGADVNLPDSQGKTPLMRAVHSDQVETLGILVKAGAKPDAVDGHGMSAYDYAVTTNKPNAKMFLSRYRGEGVKVDNMNPAAAAAAVGGFGYTRLNDHSIEVREGDGLTMTFNFWTQQVFIRDLERPAPVTVLTFSEIPRQEAVEEAYAKLKEMGGNPPDPNTFSNMHKKTPGLSR